MEWIGRKVSSQLLEYSWNFVCVTHKVLETFIYKFSLLTLFKKISRGKSNLVCNLLMPELIPKMLWASMWTLPNL